MKSLFNKVLVGAFLLVFCNVVYADYFEQWLTQSKALFTVTVDDPTTATLIWAGDNQDDPICEFNIVKNGVVVQTFPATSSDGTWTDNAYVEGSTVYDVKPSTCSTTTPHNHTITVRGFLDSDDAVQINNGDWTRIAGASTYSLDWTGQNNFVADEGATDAWQVSINQSDNYGTSEIVELPDGVKEAVFQYRALVPAGQPWVEGDSNMKMPGPTGDVSADNGGYGGSSTSIRDHDQRAWSARQLLHRPHSSFQDFAMGMEWYWHGSTNPGTSDPSDLEYGDTEWYSDTGASPNGALHLNEGVWAEVKVHVKVNDFNVANGFIRTYLNDNIGYEKTNFEWSKAEDMLNVKRLWFNVYQGGTAKSSSGIMYLFFRDFKYEILSTEP